MIRITFLGTKGGPAIRPGGPSPTATLLSVGERHYVIDCGLGVTRGIVDAGVSLKKLETILITHHHSDHNLEFGALIHTAWTSGLGTQVSAYGPPGLDCVWRGLLEAQAFDIATRIADEGRPVLGDLVAIHEYGEGPVFDDGTVRVTAMRNEHPPVRESFALKFEAEGKVVVFSGDTAYLPELAEFAKGADLLVHEALHGPAVDVMAKRIANATRLKEHLLASHTLAEDAGRIAAAAEVGQLALHHLVPIDIEYDVTRDDYLQAARTTFSGPITVPVDGQAIEL
jgi:ribonuclease BN (tRNA processing enzyme)